MTMMFLHLLVLTTCMLCCSTANIRENLLTGKKEQDLAPSQVGQIEERSLGDLKYITVRNDRELYFVIFQNSSTNHGGSQVEAQNAQKIIQQLINAQKTGSKKKNGNKGHKGGKGKNAKGGGAKKNCKAQKCNCTNSTETPSPTQEIRSTPGTDSQTPNPPIATTTTKKAPEQATTNKGTTEDYYGGGDYGDDYY